MIRNEAAVAAIIQQTMCQTLPQEADAIFSRGGSCIVDPLGAVLAGPLWDKEGIITAQIDLTDVTRALYTLIPWVITAGPTCFR